MRERSEERNGNIMEQKTSILIADPNEEFRRSCRERLCAFGYSVIAEARDGEDALSKIGTIHPDIAIVDAWLPGLDGAKLIRGCKMLSYGGDTPPAFLVISEAMTPTMLSDLTRAGADYIMMKPVDAANLTEKVAYLASQRHTPSRGVLEGGDMETQVTKVIHQIGVPAHIKGYQYLRTAILMTIEYSDVINSVTKILYPSVAKQYSTTSSRVERAIRHAIEVAWDRGDVDILNSYFGFTIQNNRGKPTNSEFIAMIADNLRLSNKYS